MNPFSFKSIPLFTINSLPVEILTEIFEFGCFDEYVGSRRHSAFLCRASLVSSKWRDVAQRILWQELALVTQGTAEKLFLSGKFGQYATRKLSIVGTLSNLGFSFGVHGGTAVKVMLGLPGLKTIWLEGVQDIEFSSLWSSNLVGLDSLAIRGCTFLQPTDPSELSAHQLSISELDYYTQSPTPDSIIPFHFFGSSLKDVSLQGRIEMLPDKEREELVSLLKTNGDHLESLSLSTVHFYADVVPIFSFFSSLQNLELHWCTSSQFIDVLHSIPSPLKKLRVALRPEFADELKNVISQLIEALDVSLVSFSSLHRFQLSPISREEFILCGRGDELLLRLEERGVEVRL